MDEGDSNYHSIRSGGKTLKYRYDFFKHDLGDSEIKEIRQVFDGTILTTGEKTRDFEKLFADYTGRKFALGVTSCTAAMHLSLLAHNIGPGDEVITTPLTFVATALSIMKTGAKPVFVDVESTTGNINANLIKRAITNKTKAILPVHLYGQMCDMNSIAEIAKSNGLKVFEDCAHSLESSRNGVRPGDLSETANYSFFATKAITCGEGGAIVTDNEDVFNKLKLLRLHGMNKTAEDRYKEGYQHWDVEIFGWKYNMDNIQAAILLPQLQRIKSNVEKRQKLSMIYDFELDSHPLIRKPEVVPNSFHARHLYTIWVPAKIRDSVISDLMKQGVGLGVNYRAIHTTKLLSDRFGYQNGDFPNAEKIGNETISLPLYPNMPEQHVIEVSRILKEVVEQYV